MDFFTARQHMVDSQVRVNDVTHTALISAMRRIERERLCASSQAFCAYAEIAPEVAPERHLIPARDLAKLIQAAHPKAGETALGIYAPYACAVLAEMGLKATALESDARALSVISPYLSELEVACFQDDMSHPKGQFDIIVIEGAVSVVPEAWLKALKEGGRLCVVLRKKALGHASLFTRRGKSFDEKYLFDSPVACLHGYEAQPEFVL